MIDKDTMETVRWAAISLVDSATRDYARIILAQCADIEAQARVIRGLRAFAIGAALSEAGYRHNGGD